MNHFRKQVAKFQARVEREASERALAIGSTLSQDRHEWVLSDPLTASSVRCANLGEVDFQLSVWERRLAA